jgi:hypothetical protein
MTIVGTFTPTAGAVQKSQTKVTVKKKAKKAHKG